MQLDKCIKQYITLKIIIKIKTKRQILQKYYENITFMLKNKKHIDF